MGKGGELWDDSALIKAFDVAISKYKVTHEVTESTITSNSSLPDNGSNEHAQVGDNIDPALVTSGGIGDSGHTSKVLENPTSELGFSAEHIDSSNIHNGSCLPNNGSTAAQSGPPEKHTISSDLKSQNEFIWNSNGQDEYNLLCSKYYELEDQRQKILQQLNQYSNWNYQTYDTSAFPCEEHQGSVPQPHNTVTCYCPYGCQNWIVPCHSMPDSCSRGTCTDKGCTVISEGVQGGTSMSGGDPNIVKTAMAAADRALSSLMKGDLSSADISANGGKEKEFGVERCRVADNNNSVTDLAEVLNAWYSAGLYTGKYLSEQSFEKKKHH